MVDLSPSVQREFQALFLGDRIGGGIGREVYAYALNPDWVVKVCDKSGDFQNVMEWETWRYAVGRPAEKWLAPCHHISFSGSILIQSRTTPVKKLPKRLPDFFTDLKAENFGMLDGRIVAHDYGLSRLLPDGLATRKMQVVKGLD